MKMKTVDAARNKWRGILQSLGIDKRHLSGKHGPCPMCEGTDRFRFDDKGGNGSWICNVCGAGNGLDLLMTFHRWDFITAARKVDAIVGNVEVEAPRRVIDDEQRAAMLNKLWASSRPIIEGDLAWRYLKSRRALPANMPACLRFAEACPVPGGGSLPAMLALVTSQSGQPASIHRTFLGETGKANIATPRAMMPGDLPDGVAIRLYPVHGERLGVAEGIETALCAARRFRVPVWATISSGMLSKWQPPHGVTQVDVFADNDPAFGGQAAAYALAHRLAARLRIQVAVHIPDKPGRDWADYDVA